MDYETFQDVAQTVSRLKMFPYCDTAHYIICAIAVKEETHLLEGGLFTRKHPFASWLATLFVCFAGGIMACTILGEPPVTPFKNEQDILLVTIVWYVINYAPFDIIYRICKLMPVKCMIYLLKELSRTKKISDGVAHAHHAMPDADFIIIAVGVVKSVGSELCAGITAHFYGVPLNPLANRYLYPTFAFKLSLVASGAFFLHAESKRFDWLPEPFVELSSSELYFSIFLFLATLKLGTVIMHITDPLRPLENIFCAFAFGGFVDAVRKALVAPTPSQPGVPSSSRLVQSSAPSQNTAANNAAAAQSHAPAAAKQSTVTPPANSATPPASPAPAAAADTKDFKKN